MAKKKSKISPEERAALERHHRETMQLLEERMTYHRAKLAEEQLRKAS